jgi:hypothetical protein
VASLQQTESTIKANKIFVRDLYEIVDLDQTIGDCLTDFMEVTVKATSIPKRPTQQ